MAKWKCSVCGYVYDEERGEPATKTPQNTRFGDLPDDWKCPVCGADTSAFEQLPEGAAPGPARAVTKWKCSVCGYLYDEEAGEPATDTSPHTRFGDLPDDWKCPVCGSGKNVFEPVLGEAMHETADTTVSDVLIAEMEAWGISLIFGLPGTSSLGLVDAVRKNPAMRYIVVRHEENAAMAASAYHKLTGKIAACLTIAGPGATNLATGLYDAKEDHASVLSINGQVATQYTGPGGIQEIDQDAFFRPVTVYNNTIYDRKMAVLLLTKALKYATLHEGVAQLSVPNDIQKLPLSAPHSSRETCIRGLPIVPAGHDLRAAADAINAAHRPVILAGWGAHQAADDVVRLATTLQAPIVTTFRSKGILPDTHEWLIGILGSVGSPHARKLVTESDLLITLGVGFSKFTNVPLDKKMVQVDTNPVKLGKNADSIPLWGNCVHLLPLLIPLLKARPKDGMTDRIAAMKDEWRALLDREADADAVPIRPPYIMKVLSGLIPDDAVIALDVGENQWWFGRNFLMKHQRFAMSGYLGTMGFGLPAAIAAKCAYPDKTVFCITGDGGFAMAMADFVTAVKYDLPMVVVVLSNRQLGMIRVEQMMEQYENYATDLLNPDFAAYADACGGVGIRVERPGDLGPAIERAMALNRPVIVDVLTDPDRFGTRGE
ncbi:MAG: rubredoxin [Methanomicrobiaceae archaeon]|nr:rubredoxin [Methanomicrobiaceae archaeon]